jgi:hypothetical protein
MLVVHVALYCALLALAATSVRTGALAGMALTDAGGEADHDGASVHHDMSLDVPDAFKR